MVETWISKRAGEYVGVTANGGDGYGRPGAGGDVKAWRGIMGFDNGCNYCKKT
jgi:hypothetical protein